MRAWNVFEDWLINVRKMPKSMRENAELLDRLREQAQQALQPPRMPWE